MWARSLGLMLITLVFIFERTRIALCLRVNANFVDISQCMPRNFVYWLARQTAESSWSKYAICNKIFIYISCLSIKIISFSSITMFYLTQIYTPICWKCLKDQSSYWKNIHSSLWFFEKCHISLLEENMTYSSSPSELWSKIFLKVNT